MKQYFALPRVLDGLFGLVERLFGVSITEDQAEGWHPDVRFYRISAGDRLVGQFYLDLYAREAKQPGAWMNDCRGRQHEEGGVVQTPVAYLVCNFQAPVNGQPALLTHDDVTTLFHEFGHGLHHMLTQVDTLAVSGISGVEWDAVELPSQFMENWAWEWDIVESMTHHVKTGEPMPRALFDRMLAARNFQAGLQTLRQIEFALFDMTLHQQAARTLAAGETDPVQRILDAVRAEVAVLLSTASRTASATSLPAATRRATTATSGPKCCRPTAMPPSRRKACSSRLWAGVSWQRYSLWAAADRPSTRSVRSEDGPPSWMPCFGIMEW